jgi:hypothetical protein
LRPIEMIFLQLTLFDVVSTAIAAADQPTQTDPYSHTSHRVNFCTHNFKLSSLVFLFPENGGSLFLIRLPSIFSPSVLCISHNAFFLPS